MNDIKKKRQIALNRLFNHLIVIGLFLAWLSIDSFSVNDVAWGVGSGIAALLFIIPTSIFTPFCYSFDNEGVSLCYVFLPAERYLWKNVSSIYVLNTSTPARTDFIDLFYATVFSIVAENEGEERFYMKGHIRKTFRTKRLLEKYWDGTIEGCLFEDVKKWFVNKKRKKQAQIKAHLTDEIVPMEREIRAEAREWLEPFVSTAKQHGFDIKTKHLYITEDLEELRNRPATGYTYTLAAEITNTNQNVEYPIVISVNLLLVRLGKTSYVGVKNKNAKEELTMSISEAINQIIS